MLYRRIATVAILPLLIALAGCSALRTMGAATFTGAALSDAQIEGVLGQPQPLTVALAGLASNEPLLPIAVGIALGGQADPLGVLVPVLRLGETTPVWILVTGDMVAQVAALKANSRVRIWARPLPGGLFRASRVTSSDAPD